MRASNRKWASARGTHAVGVTQKRCPDCGEQKPAAEFNRQPKASDGLQAYCKPCASLRGRCRRVGITVQAYLTLVEAQGGQCAICWERPANALDHCARTGTFRGLICSRCNNMLAAGRDSPALLRALAEYLERAHVGDGTPGPGAEA